MSRVFHHDDARAGHTSGDCPLCVQLVLTGMRGADYLQAMLYDLGARDPIAIMARSEWAGEIVIEDSVEANAMIAILSNGSGLACTPR